MTQSQARVTCRLWYVNPWALSWPRTTSSIEWYQGRIGCDILLLIHIAQIMHKLCTLCKYYANIMQKLRRNCTEITQKLCRNYVYFMQIMPILCKKLCKIMQNYAEIMQKLCRNYVYLCKLCKNYAQIMQKLCRNYAEIMQKLCNVPGLHNYACIMQKIMQIMQTLCKLCKSPKIMQIMHPPLC